MMGEKSDTGRFVGGFCGNEALCSAVHTEREHHRGVNEQLASMERNYDSLKDYTSNLLRIVSDLMAPKNIALRLFADKVRDVEGLVAIFATPLEEGLDILTIITDYDEDIVDRIVEVQYEMYKMFFNINLDFLIVPLAGRDLEVLVPKDAISVSI